MSEINQARVNGGSNYDSLKVAKCLKEWPFSRAPVLSVLFPLLRLWFAMANSLIQELTAQISKLVDEVKDLREMLVQKDREIAKLRRTGGPEQASGKKSSDPSGSSRSCGVSADTWQQVERKRKPKSSAVTLDPADWKLEPRSDSSLLSGGGIYVSRNKNETIAILANFQGHDADIWLLAPCEVPGAHKTLQIAVPVLIGKDRVFVEKWVTRVAGTLSDPRLDCSDLPSGSLPLTAARMLVTLPERFRGQEIFARDKSNPCESVKKWFADVVNLRSELSLSRIVRSEAFQKSTDLKVIAFVPPEFVQKTLHMSGCRGVFISHLPANDPVVWCKPHISLEKVQELARDFGQDKVNGLAYKPGLVGIRTTDEHARELASFVLDPSAAAVFGMTRWSVRNVPFSAKAEDVVNLLRDVIGWNVRLLGVNDRFSSKTLSVASETEPKHARIEIDGGAILYIQRTKPKLTSDRVVNKFVSRPSYASVAKNAQQTCSSAAAAQSTSAVPTHFAKPEEIKTCSPSRKTTPSAPTPATLNAADVEELLRRALIPLQEQNQMVQAQITAMTSKFKAMKTRFNAYKAQFDGQMSEQSDVGVESEPISVPPQPKRNRRIRQEES